MRSPPALACLAAVWVVAPALAQTAPTLAERGHQAALDHCAGCHAVDGAADSPNPGAPPFRDIGRRYDAASLPARLTAVTQQGHYSMPRRSLTAEERRALAAYIAEAAERASR